MKTATLKRIIASVTAVTICSLGIFITPWLGISGTDAHADGEVHSVYTNELIPASQASQRPIAVMMPTDKACQPSYGISRAKVLYEIMEEGNISRQLAIIDNWQDLQRIGNIRSCRDYYISIATEWDPILIHFGGVYYMKDRITAPDINNLSGTSEYGTGGDRPGSGQFYRTSDRKAPHNAYISASGIQTACASLGYSLTTRQEYYNASHFNFASGVNTLEQYASAIPGNVIDLSEIFPYTKSFLYHEMEYGCKASGVKRIRVHDIRHSHASLLVEMGFSPLLIAERLGHEKVQTTMDTYSHLYPNKQVEVARQLDGIMP